MWATKQITVDKNTTRSTPVEQEMKLSLGTIERVFIFFPPGCLGYVKATLVHYEHQFLPEDPESYIAGDDYVFDLPMNKEIKDHPSVKVVAWNEATYYDHTITVGVFLREASLPTSVTKTVVTVYSVSGQTVEIE